MSRGLLGVLHTLVPHWSSSRTMIIKMETNGFLNTMLEIEHALQEGDAQTNETERSDGRAPRTMVGGLPFAGANLGLNNRRG